MKSIDKILGDVRVFIIIDIADMLLSLAVVVSIFVYLYQKPIPQESFLKVAIVAFVAFLFGILDYYIKKKGLIKLIEKDRDETTITLSKFRAGAKLALSLVLFLCAFGVF